ncbi:hypothetical protein [Flavobacterium sp.]|uniref:hypothetical protein n=1 Tax=Flavobacterium sp. TaxID=239 RepID=UPI003751D9E0
MTINKLVHLHFISLYVVVVILFLIVIYKQLKNKKGPKELSIEKYHATMTSEMEEVTDKIKTMFNIWPFVSELKRVKILPNKINESKLVHKGFRDVNDEFEHILLTTEKENNYLVIVVDRTKKKAKGYFKLNLDTEYDLTAT